MINTAKSRTAADTESALHRAWTGLCRLGRNLWSMLRGRHENSDHPSACYDVE